jgi:CDP-L-myo-inositol myo-inositolphosphotransferase
MTSSVALESRATGTLRRVLILADESADWKIAGLRQLERLLLSVREYANAEQPGETVSVCVFWNDNVPAARQSLPQGERFEGLHITERADKFLADGSAPDLVVSTRLFLQPGALRSLLPDLPAPRAVESNSVGLWQNHALKFAADLKLASTSHATGSTWRYVSSRSGIAACERGFLGQAGKSQDGLVSRYINRPLSRLLTRLLLKLPLAPNTWSLLIFSLPICASIFLCRGTYSGFLIGCAIFQLYSILDGCDGEIARAKFLQTEFGRRLDSICDLAGNMLFALCLGIGLARSVPGLSWFYLVEGVAAAALTITSEGIVFLRRTRGESAPSAGRWNGVLYQRHHEFFERSGILFIGENFAWWLVQLTKRDMAMLAFLLLAAVGLPAWNLHLLFIVGAISSVLAGNAFLRQPAPAVAQEAS